jgi:RluA family pseudouridine synthase
MPDIEKIVIKVGDDWTGSRLDRFVRTVRPALSFPVIQTLIRKGKIRLNGVKVPGKMRLKEGDVVEIRVRRDRPGEILPGTRPGGSDLADRFGDIGMGIHVLFEDRYILAIDKPPGLPVQPGNRGELGSLLDLLSRYISPAEGGTRGPKPFNPSPVHRLDTWTSGVLVIAKTRAAARKLSGAISGGGVGKIYLAVVEGIPGSGSGTVDIPLRIEKGESSRAVPDPSGLPALTRYNLLRELPGGRALLEVAIETGRTHQIRAHLKHIGHPVAGDRVYGGGGEGRMLLHAWKISIPHPATGLMIDITAPPPPEFGL